MSFKPPAPGLIMGVAILAAGASVRMGRPKLLLNWGETTVLGHLVGLWKESGAAQVAVVCAAGDALLAAELDRLGFSGEGRIVNPDPTRGMFGSIQCAARWSGWRSTLTHWAVVLGDQPQVQLATLHALVEFAAQQPGRISQPSRGSRARHPVILPAEAWRELARSDAGTLRDFLHSHAENVRLLASEDEGLDVDLDAPGDYARAQSGFQPARGHRQ